MVDKEEKDKWIVAEVPVKTAPAIADTRENKAYSVEEALAKILNILEKLQEKL